MANILKFGGGSASGNATASDLLLNKTATVEAGEITGTMPNNGAVNITPSTSNQAISAGYHNGSGVVYGDTDLVASNIKNGVNIFGVAGTYAPPLVTTDLTAGEGIEVDTTAYLGGKLFLHTSVVSRTGGISYGSVTKGIDGWNGSAWVNICYSGVGGSGSDVWLTDDDRAVISSNPYSKIRFTGSSANNAGSARFGSAFGAKV